MADQVYLSLWLHSFSEDSMLVFWGKLLEAFPSSSSQPGVRGLAVIPFSWGETAVLEQVYAESETIEAAVDAAKDFLHLDYAYVAAVRWDMWRQKSFEELAETDVDALIDRELDDTTSGDEWDSSESELTENEPKVGDPSETLGWKRVPKEVTVACLGPEFDVAEVSASAESSTKYQNPHFRIDLGLDTLFLPEAATETEDDEDWDEAALCYRDNIAQLLGFMRRIEKAVPLKSRLLWSASGDDLGERIREAYNGS